MKIKKLGLVPYEPTFMAMQTFTQERTSETEDELWVLEHPPVFTQGMAGKAEHLLAPTDIPVVQIDRGGQVTYHGPGQLIIYTLIDFKRRKISVRDLVHRLENSIINTLESFGIHSYSEDKRPGVYVDNKKIASLGLRIKNGAVYHGLSLNVNMDLSPFHVINPCGYSGLEMVQVKDLVNHCPSLDNIADELTRQLQIQLA